MRGIFFTAPLLLLLALACGEGEEAQNTTPDPQDAAQRALAAMDALDSYRLEMTFAGGSSIGQGSPIVMEFAAPDSYRFQSGVVHAVDGTESLEGVIEAILSGDKAYSRQCQDVDRGCGDWQEGPRPSVPIAGPSPTFLLGWPLVALEMTERLEALGTEEADGLSLLHMRGFVNHIRAIFENHRRLFTAAGITSFGGECFTSPSDPVPACRDLTYEEALQNQEPQISFLDDNPATIDVWLSAADHWVRRIALIAPAPPEHEPSEALSLVIRYSRFNQVVIKPPS